MKRFAILTVVALAIALVAIPAFAEVQNVKVSGDVKTNAVYRESYNLYPDSRNSTGVTSHDNRLITNARLRVDADLTDNVSATLRALSEWEWDTENNVGGTGSSATGAQDLLFDLANVTLKEAFYSPLTVIIGRQELRYQDGFVIGDPDTNALSGDTDVGVTAGNFADLSLRKSFDAMRAILDYNPLTVDIFFAKIDETGTAKDDEDLYGINAAYRFDQYNAQAEAFWVFNRDDSETAPDVDTDAISPGHEIFTFGLSGSITPIENLNLEGLFAWQKGDFDKTSATKRDQDAFAFEVAGNYAFKNVTWEPLVRIGWTHFSGEEVDNTGDQEAWIPFYEDRTNGVVANYILSGINGGQNSNADILNVGASAIPLKDLTVSADLYWFWLDEKLVTSEGALTAADPTNYVNLTDTSYNVKPDDDLGYEIDLALNYDYTEDVKMGLSAGWFVPGDALEGVVSNNKNDETALQVLATLDVAF